MKRWFRQVSFLFMALLWCGVVMAAGFCIKCGDKLEDGVKFCPKCGHEVGKPLTREEKKAKEAPKPAPTYESIEEADNYFDLAQKEENSVGAIILPHVKRRRYKKALGLYLKILEKWPNSDKCEEAAYNAAQLYESSVYDDYDKALRYYRTVLAINPQTTLDARYQMARVTEDHIRDYEGAVTLYEKAIEEARVQDEKEEAAAALKKLLEKMEKAEERLKEARG